MNDDMKELNEMLQESKKIDEGDIVENDPVVLEEEPEEEVKDVEDKALEEETKEEVKEPDPEKEDKDISFDEHQQKKVDEIVSKRIASVNKRNELEVRLANEKLQKEKMMRQQSEQQYQAELKKYTELASTYKDQVMGEVPEHLMPQQVQPQQAPAIRFKHWSNMTNQATVNQFAGITEQKIHNSYRGNTSMAVAAITNLTDIINEGSVPVEILNYTSQKEDGGEFVKKLFEDSDFRKDVKVAADQSNGNLDAFFKSVDDLSIAKEPDIIKQRPAPSKPLGQSRVSIKDDDDGDVILDW